MLRALATDSGSTSFSHQGGDVHRGKVMGLSLGLAATIVLVYFAFSSPTVMARWTRSSYLLILILLVLTLGGSIWVASSQTMVIAKLSTVTLLIWNALFVLSLTLILLAYQVRFPLTTASYPPVTLLPLTRHLLACCPWSPCCFYRPSSSWISSSSAGRSSRQDHPVVCWALALP